MTSPDDFMWEVADLLGRLDLTHNAAFQEFCANTCGCLSVIAAAEEWERR